MSHPIVMDAISQCFIATVTDGRNWPTVEFSGPAGGPAYDKVGYSRRLRPLLSGMVRALETRGRDVPAWLRLTAAELGPRPEKRVPREFKHLGKATFSMG